MVEDKDIENVISIEDDKIDLELGGTRLTISGIISKRHALILVILILGMLGYNWDTIMGVTGL